MKRVVRQSIAAAIKAGLPYLWNGRGDFYSTAKQDFVCFAVRHGSHPASDAARSMIAERIHPYSTVDDWLEEQGVKNITDRKLQAYRKAWMLSMIEEFSK